MGELTVKNDEKICVPDNMNEVLSVRTLLRKKLSQIISA